MRRIDADALELDAEYDDGEFWAYSKTQIENAPTIEPEQPEIIRCKDCKHYNAGFECLIEGYGIERDKNWFCGDAERRTDEQNT